VWTSSIAPFCTDPKFTFNLIDETRRSCRLSSIVTALNDVMSDAGYNEPRLSWHGSFLLNIDPQLKMPVGVRKINKSVPPHYHYIHYTNLANRSCTASAAQESHNETRITLVGPMVNREPIPVRFVTEAA